MNPSAVVPKTACLIAMLPMVTIIARTNITNADKVTKALMIVSVGLSVASP